MPTYEYSCPKCGFETELVRSISDESPGPLCCQDNCNGETMVRVLSASSFVLKGSGWAKDGYAGKKS